MITEPAKVFGRFAINCVNDAVADSQLGAAADQQGAIDLIKSGL